MKIALLTNFIPPYRRLLYLLVAKKFELLRVFISTRMESDRSWEVNHEGLEVTVQKTITYRKEWKHENGYNQFSDTHIPYDTLFKLIKYRPDVVISAELGIRSLFSALYCSVFNKKLILWLALSEHTESNKTGVRIALRKYILRNAAAILCNGESAKNYVKSIGISKPFYYVPYSSDYKTKPSKNNFNSTIKRILFTGQLIPRKGIAPMVDELVSWALKNKSTQLELIVAGDGPEAHHFKKLDQSPNITCKLLGNVKYEELSKWYEQVDFYLFPTLGDEWGIVVNEALSNGVPVIGSIYSQAVLELIEDDKNGWQYDPLVNGELGKLLTKAFKVTNDDLQKMSAYGLEVVKEISTEKVSETIVRAVNESMGSISIVN